MTGLVRVLLLSFLSLATCHPGMFVRKHSNGKCASLPSRALGHHGAPTTDSDTSIDLLANKRAVVAYCPGSNYTIKVAFSEPRLALMTTSFGRSASMPCTDKPDSTIAHCCSDNSGTRWVLQGMGEHKESVFETAVFIPCSAEGALEVAVASASGAHDSYHVARKSINKAANCPVCSADLPVVDTANVQASDDSAEHDHEHDHTHGSDDDGSDSGDHQEAAPAPVEHMTPVGKDRLCKQADVPNGASPLGYARSMLLDQEIVRLHYTYGSCIPHNPCTEGASWHTHPPASNELLLHIVAEANTSGYVAFGFAKAPGLMMNTDAVLGYITAGGGAHKVAAYNVPERTMSEGDAYPAGSGVITYAGVWKTSSGTTIICFGRPLHAPAAQNSRLLPLNDTVAVNWAVAEEGGLSMHSRKGGSKVSLAGGSVTAVAPQGGLPCRFHGVTMLLAWLVLMPLGVISARHRWAFGAPKPNQTQKWFLAHQAFQVVGLALQLSSGGMALLLFRPGPGLGTAHQAMGIATLVVALLQFAAALLRPKPDGTGRRIWALGHAWTGGLLMCLAWATCGLGVFLLRSMFQDNVLAWLLPCGAVLLLLVGLEIGLRWQKGKNHFPSKSAFKLVPMGRGDVALPEFQRLRHESDDL